MLIKKIKISNFKSFKELDVDLGKFTVLIGANASGKSNFIQIIKFFKDIIHHGLDNAISMQGGIEYLRNINIGSSENFSLEVVSDEKFKRTIKRTKEKKLIQEKVFETIYKFSINFHKKGLGFEIINDIVTQKFHLVESIRQKDKTKEEKNIGQGEICFSNINGRINLDRLKLPDGVPIKKEDIFIPIFKEEKLERKRLLCEMPFLFLFMPPLFTEISIYDFDPKLPKKASPITGKAELEEDGSNLAIVLKTLLENKEKEGKLSNLVRDLLPFVDAIDVEKFADKSLLFNLREIFTKKQYIPASLISDGTINITALIIALYFEKTLLAIIEEPERNIHPHLISKVIEMIKEASEKKQIIVTTHNPELIKHVDLKDILFISRDKKGFSVISRPSEQNHVKTFLKNEIGIEELYVQNLLGK